MRSFEVASDIVATDPNGNIHFDRSRERRANRVTRRFDINMGFKCNFRCKFCYYLGAINAGKTRDLSTEEVKRRLRVGRSWGKTAVDLTGGEPTMREDLAELVSFARKIGYQTVCIITNGWIIGSNKDYLQKLAEAGLNDILMSLHGPDAETHQELTGKKGSYERFLAAVERVKHTPGVRLRFNHVICEQNFEKIEKSGDLLASFEPDAMNFILFQPTRDALRAEKAIKFRSYKQVTPHLAQAIEKHRARVPRINVRDLPFCLLKGFEPHIKTMFQLQYEKVEWDYCLDVIFKKGYPFYGASAVFGAILSAENPYFRTADWDNKRHLAIQRARAFTMRKQGGACARCAITHICDGLVKDYFERCGDGELSPYSGERITNPTYFIERDELE